ncbi:hypothetical protein I4F81_012833 [Pyropia yezoensis]|uniref:Uncharacterized protein n=1 Tax=Pyropia yezoensis TaxID=2788 RepID=A0ACC3CK24_PYRYE|nr:hypothetical protein I4F81_012833 [Neopyropia yezoensis]
MVATGEQSTLVGAGAAATDVAAAPAKAAPAEPSAAGTMAVADPAPIDLSEKVKALLAGAAASTDRAADAKAVAEEATTVGVFAGDSLVATLKATLADSAKSKGPAREATCLLVSALVAKLGAPSLPFLAGLVTDMIQLLADKGGKGVIAAATKACEDLTTPCSAQAKKMVILPQLVTALGQDMKWQTQAGALELIIQIARDAPQEMGTSMPDLVSAISPLMCHAKAQVSGPALKSMQDLCSVIENSDIQPVVPDVISALKSPTEADECIFKLAAIVFVQQVECNALAIFVPLLKRGFQGRNTAVKRMCAKIIENMAKLVERPSDLAPFLPTLLPALQRASDEISDPEARAVCTAATNVLDQKSKGVGLAPEPPRASKDQVIAAVSSVTPSAGPLYTTALDFTASCFCALMDALAMSKSEWQLVSGPVLAPYFAEGTTASDFAAAVLAKCEGFVTIEEEEEDADAEELCRCKFSLAYGSKVLLNNTKLNLKRGFRYGLLGPNECGKTTLMRAIANDQVEGFPPADEVRTVFVEADILGELSHLSVVDYIVADPNIVKYKVSKEDICTVLTAVGFTPGMQTGGVSHLSGGWRMKLALSRAMLQKADILLLDEPTNHLDAVNVKWVEDYLNGLSDVTSIIVSHDSGLLERVCTHIIQIESLKLWLHKGNLSEFVKKVPQAKAYFELKSDKFKFNFPQPGFLEGVKSKGKAVIKMDKVQFTYPTASRPQVAGITIRCSLSSRVACIGPNGAGKSTIIKLLTGELEPDSGDVWKHPNLRVGYIAQHAFHHIESHLEKTPNQYIQWRYQYGDDRETLAKATMVVSDEEMKQMKQPVMHVWQNEEKTREFREKLVIDRLTTHRRNEKGSNTEFEYEVIWEKKPQTFTSWLRGDKLRAMGWDKTMKAVDEKVASRAGSTMALTSSNVEKHLENVGLDREFGTHCRIGALSGGQKVKVVLAAAMWNQPHIVILDEPTNYLDRDSLGALAGAIKEFDGGVVIISHNSEFTSAVCPETWVLSPATETEPAKLDLQGDAEWMKEAMSQTVDFKIVEEIQDGQGNTIKVAAPKSTKKLSRKQIKARERKRAAQKACGEYYPGCNGTDEDEWDA